ncbi:hypothetical protein [Microbacterium aurantiacum]|uniref:hypothetical protein n=1 Tax=Microbacterium aurantiacum TaxID=162393 RepID=UPI003439D614
MDVEELHQLATADRWVFVIGRIATDAVAMDAALRGVHASLRGRDDRNALLEAPDGWSATMRECVDKLSAHDLDDTMRSAIRAALDDAGRAWSDRNRYMHDLLVDSIDVDDEPPTIERESRAEDDRYRLRLARKKNAPEHETVSLDDAINLVLALVAARWRLRAARSFLTNRSTVWRGMLVGHVQGSWDGNADWISADDV